MINLKFKMSLLFYKLLCDGLVNKYVFCLILFEKIILKITSSVSFQKHFTEKKSNYNHADCEAVETKSKKSTFETLSGH